MSLTIRGERPDDLAMLQEILSDAGFADQAWELQHPARYYDMFVAVTEDGEVVGVLDGKLSTDYDVRIAPHVTPPQAWISTIAVARSHRRTGVGRALVAAFARAAREAGSTHLVCKVDESNETSGRMSFFRSCGLHSVMPDQEDDVVAGPLDKIIDACERTEGFTSPAE
ncbi:GNAT family N-acetyltransferase [Pseudonocardia cypriaca]|uniref:Ribosomal protein S18 acetylase RimI-like enzyme n=1 Tax=Pseudonocardia cypriaca TaxID=882449 RepID=A0A543GFG9_9PSEU|nr:GNAT family N-acetyltransferase [Pseudonocardia cypriaca]TQM44828.1 ribosomal protein S18 acetylase RimI-like enzyme [Pseudonocardia cypriaca]